MINKIIGCTRRKCVPLVSDSSVSYITIGLCRKSHLRVLPQGSIVGSRVFGDHVGVHLDLRNVGDPVEREGLADSHLPTPDVRDVTRPIGHPLFVDNLEVLESPTIRKKVEEATGGRAVYTRSRPICIVMSKHKSP